MSYNEAIRSISSDALGYLGDYSIVGLGSGRAATILVKALGRLVESDKLHVVAVPTSMQIKMVAEECGISIISADQVDHIDVVFDGADQISSDRHVIKGGGGALFYENILFNLAKKVIVMADSSKFVKKFTRSVPVEVHPHARTLAAGRIVKLGGIPKIRIQQRYPFFTENGNIILDCDFGTISNPRKLSQNIRQIPGVLESGMFLKRPDIIYKAKKNGKFELI